MNKLVLVSGAGRGLGASIAESFVNSGYKVAINYFNSAKRQKIYLESWGILYKHLKQT